MKPELFYPINPYIVNQVWGVSRPEIYSSFGFTQHNGVDIRVGADATVRGELPCEAYSTGWQPTGGGLYLTVLSKHAHTFSDGKVCHILIDYLHLKEIKKNPGQDYNIEVGEIIAIPNNTGFSTGPHTHIQYRRVYKTPTGLIDVDTNEANGSFDPEPYRNGQYADEYRKAQIAGLQKSLDTARSILLDLLAKLKWHS